MKRLSIIILAIVLCMAMSFTVYADDKQYVFDEAEFITSASEETLNEKAAGIYEDTGVVISYLVTNDPGDSATDYAKESYKKNFGKADGIMLIETEEVWSIYKQGEAEKIFTAEDEESMWDVCADAEYYNEGAEAYLDKASAIMSSKGITAKSEKEETEPTEATTAAEATDVKDTNHPVRLVDDADLLEAEEEAELGAKLDEISERQNFDVVIVTVDSLGGKTPEAFADDYFDYNGYGMGNDDDGILFAVSMSERKMAFSTHAYGITVFTDAGQEYIWDMITPYMSGGTYLAAFNEFADLCDDYIDQAKTGEPYDVGNMPDRVGVLGIILWIIPSFVIAAIISLFLKKKKRKSLKSVMMRNDASDYWDEINMTEEYDMYLRRDIITVKVKSEDNGGSGGSTIHVSSSGRTHGGSSHGF